MRKNTAIRHKRPRPFFCCVTPIHIRVPDQRPNSTPNFGKYLIRSNENGMSMYIDLLKMLSIDWRGEGSDNATKPMRTAWASLIHRLKEMKGIGDQIVLMSMNIIRAAKWGFSFMALSQSNRLRISINRAKLRSPIKNA